RKKGKIQWECQENHNRGGKDHTPNQYAQNKRGDNTFYIRQYVQSEAEIVHKSRNPLADPSIFGKRPHKRDDTSPLVSAQIEQQGDPQDPCSHHKPSPSSPRGKAIIEQDAKTKQREEHQHVKYSLDNDGCDRVGSVDVIICP